MAIYKLDVEKKFGQLRFRLYPQASAPGVFGSDAPEMKAFIEHLDAAIEPLTPSDSVFFRGIEYSDKVALRETVRLSRF